MEKKTNLNRKFSARSKVKGHLQLYHAFIPDPNEPVEESSDRTLSPPIEVSHNIANIHLQRLTSNFC